MTHEKVEEKQIGQYLLGQLGDDAQRQLEERLMTQDDLFEQLQVLEEELIDEYLKNTLSVQDREDFEKHFLSAPERRKKLRFAQAFRSYVATANAGTKKEHSKSSLWQTFWAALRSPTPVLRYGLPMVLVGVLVGGLWMAGTIRRLHTEVAHIRTEQGGWQERAQQLQQQLEEQGRRSQELEQQLQQQLEEQRQRSQALEQLEQQLARAQAQQRPGVENPLPAMVAFALTPGLVRDFRGSSSMVSGTLNRVTIPSGTRLVELKLELGDNRYQDYRAVLESEGSEILIVNKVKPERIGTDQFIVLTLPANILPHADYSLKLSGVGSSGEYDPIGNYSFRVLRR